MVCTVDCDAFSLNVRKCTNLIYTSLYLIKIVVIVHYNAVMCCLFVSKRLCIQNFKILINIRGVFANVQVCSNTAIK